MGNFFTVSTNFMTTDGTSSLALVISTSIGLSAPSRTSVSVTFVQLYHDSLTASEEACQVMCQILTFIFYLNNIVSAFTPPFLQEIREVVMQWVEQYQSQFSAFKLPLRSSSTTLLSLGAKNMLYGSPTAATMPSLLRKPCSGH